MAFVHASLPRAINENGRTGIKIIESSGTRTSLIPSPQTNSAQKKIYRDEAGLGGATATTDEFARTQKANIMYDKRVARGTTAGKTAVLIEKERSGGATTAKSKPSSASQSYQSSRPSKQSLIASGQIRPAQPTLSYIHSHIVVTKKRVEIPLHHYLIEQKEEVLTKDNAEQTDVMREERPERGYYQPRKSGVDTGTQVDTAMIFNFDTDIQPLLEILVSKTLEQSLMEVREEEECSLIVKHQNELQEKYDSEEKESEKRLIDERVAYEQKERVLQQARLKQKAILQIRAKLAAAYFSRVYLENLIPSTMQSLRKEGLFQAQDNISYKVEKEFLPDVLKSVDSNLTKEKEVKGVLEMLLKGQVEQKEQERVRLLEEREKQQEADALQAEKDLLAAEELSKRRQRIQLFIHSSIVPPEQNPVGPLNLTGESTIAEVEQKVWKWMEANMEEKEIPKKESVKFLWNGKVLNTTAISNDASSSSSSSSSSPASMQVYDLGIGNLATLTMEVDAPSATEKGEEEDEEEETEQAEAEEEQEEHRDEEEEEQPEEDEDGENV